MTPYKKRISLVIKNIRSSSYLVTDRADIIYLTGVELEGFYLLIAKKKVYAVCPAMLETQLRSLLPGISVVSGAKMVDAISKVLKAKRVSTLGVRPKISHDFYLRLRAAFKIDLMNPVPGLRKIKDRTEIENIKKSCKIAAKVYNLVSGLVRPGVTERQISFKIEEYFAKFGVKPAFPAIVAFGPNTANPHHMPTLRKASKNEIITIDMGCIYKGYCSDLTRTFFLGKIPASRAKAFIIIREAQKAAVKAIRNAKKARDLDKIARDIVTRNGFGKYFIHSTGHGVGLEVHEDPRVNSSSKEDLAAGMIITIEPGIYFPGKYGVRIEDTVLVGPKGPQILTA